MKTYEEKKELNNCNCSTPCSTNVVQHIHHNSTTLVPKSQCLADSGIEALHEKEIKEKFTVKKKKGEQLVFSFLRLGMNKRAESVVSCGTFLEFARYPDKYKLHRANFCRDRLCPMCSWRRSYKIFGQVSQIMDVLDSDYAFIFLTLTVPNCEADELSNTLDELSKGWSRLIKYKRFSKACKGFFKALEVTYSSRLGNYHPHYHVILAVSKSYFKGRDYINHDEWLDMWRKAMRDPSITQVDVRRVRDKDSSVMDSCVKSVKSAVAEIAKYSVKDSDYLIGNSEKETDFRVYTFAEALHNRRLCAFGGCFKVAHDKLGLDDAETGDLIHVDGDIRSDVALQIVRYRWSCGAYNLVEVLDKSPLDMDNVLADCDE